MIKILSRPENGSVSSMNDIEEDDTDRLVTEAVLDALRDHKQAGNAIAVWEDGKVKIIQPEDIVLPDESSAATRPAR